MQTNNPMNTLTTFSLLFHWRLSLCLRRIWDGTPVKRTDGDLFPHHVEIVKIVTKDEWYTICGATLISKESANTAVSLNTDYSKYNIFPAGSLRQPIACT